MFDLYLQITVALLLAFLLGFLIAKMWIQNRRHEYLAKITQLKTKLTVEEAFKQQQVHRISLLQDQEQQLSGSMNELTSIKTALNIEVVLLNKNIENKQNELVSVETSLNKILEDKENKYLEDLMQLETKLTIEEEFKQQQAHKISLLEDREQQLITSVDELKLIETSLNKNLENKNKQYLKELTQLETKLTIEEELKQQQAHKIALLEDREQQLITSVDELKLIETSLNKNFENKNNQYLKELTQLETKLTIEEEIKQQQAHKMRLLENNEKQLTRLVDELTLTKSSLGNEITKLNRILEDKQIKIVEVINNKEEIDKKLEIKSTQNNQLIIDLQLATKEQDFLNSQIQTLTENHQTSLKTIEFMEAQASTFSIQQDQFQHSLEQSTQQYESMDSQINTLSINEKEALEKIHEIENKYLDLSVKNELVEEERTGYCDKLLIAHNEQTELEAHALVRNYTFSAISVAIIPIPFIDLATLLGIQIIMLDGLAEKYAVDFSENKVKSLVYPLLSSTLSMTGAVVFSSFIKTIPGIGQASGMVSLSILAGTMTYAVGEIFIEHFESGGTFLDFDVEKQKVRFRELYEKGKQMLVDSEAQAT